MTLGLGSDLRYTLRVLARSPGFTAVAVLSLALGIGATTAMFGVVKTLLLTPMPVEAPEELAIVAWRTEAGPSISQNGTTSYEDPDGGPSWRSSFSYPLYEALRDAAPGGADLFGFHFLRGVSLAVGDQPAFLAGGALADGRYFAALRPRMALGRPLTGADDVPDAPLVTVLSHSLWMRAFGGDPEVIGRTVRVNGNPAEVVGVTAEGFKGLSMGGFFPQTEITVPLSSQPRVYARMSPERSLFTADEVFWIRLMARVPDGVSMSTVQQALGSAMRAAAPQVLTAEGPLPEVRLLPGAQGAQPVNPDIARLLYFLLAVVGAVLLIACVNLASLMLARGVSRQRDLAVRRALGGGRVELVRQMLLEGVVLAVAGSTAGLVLTIAGREWLRGILTGSLGAGAFGDLEMEVAIDPLVLGVSAGLGILATLLFGLLPALRSSGVDPALWLKHRGAGSATPRLTLGRLLIALQIGVSIPLVVGAVLFLRTVANLGAVELGFDPRGIAEFQVDPGYTELGPEAYPRLYQELLAGVAAVPGVRSVTLMENALMSGIVSNSSITIEDRRVSVYMNAVGPAFLETLGMRLLAGRMPGLQDDRNAPSVGVVNETAVREIYGGSSPIGQVLRVGSREYQIVGVVNDTPYRRRRDPVPATLFPSAFQRDGFGGHHVVLRTDVPLARLEPLVREAVHRVHPDLPVPRIRSQTELMAQTGSRERVFTQLLTLFGAFALVLASIGLHGVTAYSVTRRTSEIGVRMAVGARPAQVLWLILRQVVTLAALGLVIGVPVALAAGPVIASLLYGVAPDDLATIAIASVLMVGVAVGAGLVPALRAARMDAIRALGAE